MHFHFKTAASFFFTLVFVTGCGDKFPLPVVITTDLAVTDSSYVVVDEWKGFAGLRDIFAGRDGMYIVDTAGLHRHVFKDGSKDAAFKDVLGDSIAAVFQSDGGLNYVAYTKGSVEWYDGSGTRIGSFFAGGMLAVTSIVVDRDTNVYLADSSRNVIQKYRRGFYEVKDSVQVFAAEGKGCRNVVRPHGMFLDTAGNILVASTGENWINIMSLDPSKGCYNIGGNTQDGGKGDNLLRSPMDVTVDRLNNIYVVDTGNRLVKKYSPQGNFIVDLGATSSGGSLLGIPVAAAALTKSIYICDVKNNRVVLMQKPEEGIIGIRP